MISAHNQAVGCEARALNGLSLPRGSLAWENVIFTDTEQCHLVTLCGEQLFIGKHLDRKAAVTSPIESAGRGGSRSDHLRTRTWPIKPLGK